MIENIISRKILFPKALVSSKFKFSVVEGEADILMKFELLGMTNQENYDLNPFMDEFRHTFGNKWKKL